MAFPKGKKANPFAKGGDKAPAFGGGAKKPNPFAKGAGAKEASKGAAKKGKKKNGKGGSK